MYPFSKLKYLFKKAGSDLLWTKIFEFPLRVELSLPWFKNVLFSKQRENLKLFFIINTRKFSWE